MARNYACLLHEYLEEWEELGDAEVGRLTRALLKYSMTGEPIKLGGNERFYAKRLMTQEDKFQENYISSVRSEAGKKGASSRWQNDGKNFAIWQKWQNGEIETEIETKKETDVLASIAGIDSACDRAGESQVLRDIAEAKERGITIGELFAERRK